VDPSANYGVSITDIVPETWVNNNFWTTIYLTRVPVSAGEMICVAKLFDATSHLPQYFGRFAVWSDEACSVLFSQISNSMLAVTVNVYLENETSNGPLLRRVSGTRSAADVSVNSVLL